MVTQRRQWATTGDQQLIDAGLLAHRLPDFDPRTGDHCWIVITCYRVIPEQWQDRTHTPMLDGENLLSITVPACYHCEQAWTATLATRRCKGRP